MTGREVNVWVGVTLKCRGQTGDWRAARIQGPVAVCTVPSFGDGGGAQDSGEGNNLQNSDNSAMLEMLR